MIRLLLALMALGFGLCAFLPTVTVAEAASSPVIPAPSHGQARAHAARLAGDGERTRLVVDLDRPVKVRTFTLARPYRVVVDLDDAVFMLAVEPGQAQRGLVRAYRYGQLAAGKARMVLDLTDPAIIEKTFILDPVDDQPARLVVDLVKTDAETFARTLPAAVPSSRTAAPPPDTDPRPVIVVDPGHGGIDSGTTGYSAHAEKNIVLQVGLVLRDKLEKSGAYRVVMTRNSDVFVPLGARVRIARDNRAALFISLHADALARGDGKARGASVYTLSETASDGDAARLAEQENKADLIAGVDLSDEPDEVADILVDLAQRETRSFSAYFARELVGSLKTVARTHRDALKSAGFRVLRAHDVPSVLVELGYMSSRDDLKLLMSDAWRDQVTDAMLTAIDAFFAARAGRIGQASARVNADRNAN